MGRRQSPPPLKKRVPLRDSMPTQPPNNRQRSETGAGKASQAGTAQASSVLSSKSGCVRPKRSGSIISPAANRKTVQHQPERPGPLVDAGRCFHPPLVPRPSTDPCCAQWLNPSPYRLQINAHKGDGVQHLGQWERTAGSGGGGRLPIPGRPPGSSMSAPLTSMSLRKLSTTRVARLGQARSSHPSPTPINRLFL